MPHLVFDMNEDDTIRAVYKDGVRMETGTRLEMPMAIVQTYFTSAFRDLQGMTPGDDKGGDNRRHGLQCFLMSLVGTEAFLNVFFHLAGRERALPKVIDLANKNRSTLEHKLAHLPRQTYGTPLPAQKRLTKKMRELYDLRSAIVHPKWTPSSLAMPGLMIDGLVENQQQLFEDRAFCHDVLLWCLLVVARVGIHAAGDCQPNRHFVWQWTGLQETNVSLSEALGVPAEGS